MNRSFCSSNFTSSTKLDQNSVSSLAMKLDNRIRIDGSLPSLVEQLLADRTCGLRWSWIADMALLMLRSRIGTCHHNVFPWSMACHSGLQPRWPCLSATTVMNFLVHMTRQTHPHRPSSHYSLTVIIHFVLDDKAADQSFLCLILKYTATHIKSQFVQWLRA